MFQKGFLCLAWFSIFSGTLLILLVTFWLIYPYNPLEFKSPIKILTKHVKAGDHLQYTIDYCKNIDIPATLTKEFVDGVVFATSPVITNNPQGCSNTVGVTVVPNIPSGKYKIRFTYVYKVNPLREISVTTESDDLFIIEEK